MKKLLFLPVVALAGAATAALLAASSARAYTIDQLPNLGYSVVVDNLSGGCHGWQAGFGNASKTDLGSDCDPGFQQRLDDFVNATCPCAQTTANTTTTAPTTPATPTTTDTTQTSTTPAPPVTTTPTPDPGPGQTVTTVTTVTTVVDTTADQIASLDARITQLERQIAALTTRVDRLELAGDAASLAFEQALEGGADPAAAAQLARGTYLNAVNGLGQFS